jgi:pimeloyl-ACP methyl ester carboxylesterase
VKLNRITIPSGTASLAGLTYEPDSISEGIPCVILSHGYTASKESMDLMAAYLAQRGYQCLTFDCRGHKLGASTGLLTELHQAVDDLRTAARWAMEHFQLGNCVLAGHSMGALLSFAAAVGMDEVIGVAAVAVGPQPTHGFRSPVGQAMLALRSDYVEGIEPMRLLEQLEELVPTVDQFGDRPTLFVAAKADVLVKSEKMRELSERAGQRAEFQEIEGSHLDAPDRARGTVAGWLDRTVRSLK